MKCSLSFDFYKLGVASFRNLFLNLVLVITALPMSLYMKGDWLPLMYFYFIGTILPQVCKTKFSNASYDIFSAVVT